MLFLLFSLQLWGESGRSVGVGVDGFLAVHSRLFLSELSLAPLGSVWIINPPLAHPSFYEKFALIEIGRMIYLVFV